MRVGTLGHVLAGRQGLSPVMIGRASALARLASLVRAADPSRPGDAATTAVALVAGEAGVGKTRLLRELAATVLDGTLVLAGEAEPGSLGRPLDVVNSLVGEASPGHGDPRAVALDTIVERVRGRRAVIIFEDLHWADTESVAVFELLAAQPLPGLVLVGSYRPDELTRRLPGGEMLVRLERRHQVHQVQLERLSRREVGAFLGAVYGRQLSTAVVDALWGRTGGNPFFLEEILAAAGDIEPESLAEQPLPWSLAELVRRQLDGLSADERRVVEAAAVLGARASFDVLATLTRCTEEHLIDQLRALVERGLVVEEDDDEFSFRHALVRDAVEGQLLGRERRRLHEQALQALREAGSSDLADLARHAAGAGHYEEMVELARQGMVHYLSIGSTHQALRLAVDALAECPDDLELLAGAGRAAWLIGATDEAIAHASRFLQLARAACLERQSEALRLVARIEFERGGRDAMWTAVNELTALIDRLPQCDERAAAMAAVAQVHMLQFQPETAIEWADRAIAEAEAVGADAVRVQAMVERGSAMADIPQRRAAGRVALLEAIAEAERIDDWVLAARGLNNMIKYDSLGTREGRAMIERMRDAGNRAGFNNVANYYNRMAEVSAFDGDMSGAHHYLDRSQDNSSDPYWIPWTFGLRAGLLLEEGRLDETRQVLNQLEDLFRRRERAAWYDEWWLPSYDLQLAARLADSGAARDAFDRLARSGRLYKHFEAPNDLLSPLEAALLIGIPEADVREVLGKYGAFARLGEGLGAFEAIAAAARGDHAAVLAALESDLDGFAASVPAYRRVALQVALARALASNSRLSDARAIARQARQALERWPGWRRDEVDALLHRLDGAGSVEGTDCALTPREREVAGLLAEGLTNAELARRLFISPKTAAVHVSNILMKLGMSSRAEVAAWAVRNHLADTAPTSS